MVWIAVVGVPWFATGLVIGPLVGRALRASDRHSCAGSCGRYPTAADAGADAALALS